MAIYMWREYVMLDYLCFTANTADSKVTLNKTGSPTAVTLETSTDGINWTTYSFGSLITLSNIGDKVYWRNTSETTTGFSKNTSNYYYFDTPFSSTKISASGDINYLLCKNSTTTISAYCFYRLFYNCTWLQTAPKLPATTLGEYCYSQMFYNCTGLTTITELPAISLSNYCYNAMFRYCSQIKLSTSQTGEYQTAYRIPTTGTGTAGYGSLATMFNSTGGTWVGAPSINTTYYTSNQVI